MSDNDLDRAAKHAADDLFPTFSGVLDVDELWVTDGNEVTHMNRQVFEDTYSRAGWWLLDTTQPDPQWPTEDPDQPTGEPDDWAAVDSDNRWFVPATPVTPAEESA